jgi:hypothetical protein
MHCISGQEKKYMLDCFTNLDGSSLPAHLFFPFSKAKHLSSKLDTKEKVKEFFGKNISGCM